MQIERVTDVGVLEAIYRLRVTAWRARVPDFPDIGLWTDAFDAEALHWVVFERGEPVAAARLTVHEALADTCDISVYRSYLPSSTTGPIGVMSRLVVGPNHARLGLAAPFDYVRLDFARRLGCVCVLADAHQSTGRVNQLREAGFRILGPAGPTSSTIFAAARTARGPGDTALVKWLIPDVTSPVD